MSGPKGPRWGASVRSKMRSASAMSAAIGANASPAFPGRACAGSFAGSPPETAGETVAIAVPIARPSRSPRWAATRKAYARDADRQLEALGRVADEVPAFPAVLLLQPDRLDGHPAVGGLAHVVHRQGCHTNRSEGLHFNTSPRKNRNGGLDPQRIS